MTDRYENIRKALAMGPTPGPWEAHDPSESGWVDITRSADATPLCYAVPYSDYQYDAELDCKRWVSRAHETPANAAYIAACDPDTIRELLAERDQLAAALEAARVDAERWRHARRILTVEDIESSQDMFDAFGVEGDEHENRKVDAAIDAHLREELRGAREAGWRIDTKHLLEDRDGCD